MPLLDKESFHRWLAQQGDTRDLDHSVNRYCRELVRESGITTGSRVVVTRGSEVGREFTVTDIDHAEAEVRGPGSGGWWPAEAVALVSKPSKRLTRALAREGNR